MKRYILFNMRRLHTIARGDKMHELKIKNAVIFDYETGEKLTQEVAVNNGKISEIGINLEEATIEIDAKNKILAPGFIDIHMHEEDLSVQSEDPYDISYKMLTMGVTTCVAGNCGNNKPDIEIFFNYVDLHNSPVNYMTFVGHNYLRKKIGIEDRYRVADDKEITMMKALIKDYLDNYGVIGVSFGIAYSPGITYNEIIRLLEDFQGQKMLIAAHYREKTETNSIRELINISKELELPMQISHIGSCCAFGMMDETLRLINNAVENGIDVKADCYPYTAFSTRIGSAVFDDGCFEKWDKDYKDVLLTEEPYKNVVCDEETFKKVRKEYPEMLVVSNMMNESEVIKAIKSPNVYIASDGVYNNGQGHPRGAGTFPKVLGKYVREQGELTLLEALKKITVEPAQRLGLNHKGEIKVGYDADLVIFDPETINPGATYKNPTEPPKGIDYVILNGKIAVHNNEIIHKRLGKMIRKNELNNK